MGSSRRSREAVDGRRIEENSRRDMLFLHGWYTTAEVVCASSEGTFVPKLRIPTTAKPKEGMNYLRSFIRKLQPAARCSGRLRGRKKNAEPPKGHNRRWNDRSTSSEQDRTHPLSPSLENFRLRRRRRSVRRPLSRIDSDSVGSSGGSPERVPALSCRSASAGGTVEHAGQVATQKGMVNFRTTLGFSGQD